MAQVLKVPRYITSPHSILESGLNFCCDSSKALQNIFKSSVYRYSTVIEWPAICKDSVDHELLRTLRNGRVQLAFASQPAACVD
jgi:hypothetical protein